MALTQISTGGVKDDAVTAGKIPADAVGQSEIADEAVDEARLQVSNAGTNGQFLQKQSGNTGGLTWATATTDTSDKASLSGATFTGDIKLLQSGTQRLKVGSTDASGAMISLDGDSNGDCAGDDYAYILHNSDGDLVIAGDNPAGDADIIIKAGNNAEKFRVGSAGQLGVGGATYGTSGQVLTSGGASAAPSWAAIPPAGNTVDLVADGAIAAGKPVIIKSNGKAQQVKLVQTGKDSVDSSNTPSGSTGTTFTDQVVYGGESRLAYDPITKKIVLITKGGNAGDTYYQIGTENSSNNQTIDWTTKVELWGDNENNFYETSDLVYAGNSRFLYIWTLNSGVSKVKIGKATSSGFSWSSALDLYENDSMFKGFNSVKLTDDRVAIQANAKDADGPWDEDKSGILIIDITSDTTIAYRNSTQLDTDSTEREKELNTLSYDSTNGILFATWETTGGVGRCCALKVASGTSATITKSSSNVQIDTTIAKQDACYHAGQDKFLIAYQGEVGVNPGTEVKVATVNSTSLAVTLADGAVSTRVPTRGLKINEGIDDQIYMTLVDSDQKMWTALSTNFSGGSFTFAAPSLGREVGTTFSGAWYYFEQLFIPDFGTAKNLLVMSGGGSSDYSSWYTYKTSLETSNATTNTNVIGFAEDAINDTATGSIKLYGNVVGNQSSLTAGTLYYHQANGSLATSGDNSIGNMKAGMALSATKLLIYNPLA